MNHSFSFVVLFGLLAFACGCNDASRTDEQYLADWRNAESKSNVLHEGGTWHFEFVSVRLYRHNWDNQYIEFPILSAGKLSETREPKEGILLSPSQVDRLEAAVTGSHADTGIALCHFPHHGFVFFDGDGAPVGSVDVCFLCGNVRTMPQGYAESCDLLSLAELIHEAGVPLRNPEWKH